ncbi:MAG: tetratricopeptide repeat protein 39 [Ignavibacteriaceae bacterium]|nr:tetratricopeptide repeat protein 39 [Ignavibacteriaceae bacterium]
MKSITILILTLLLLFRFDAFSQKPKYDSLVTVGINQIYSIKFTEADKTFQLLKKEYPKHPASRFFFAMIDWWKIILSEEDEEKDERFFEKIEETVDFCDEILDKDPTNVDALFFKGGAIGFRGRLRVMRESWFSAADDGREALPLVETASKLDPDNVDVKLGFGIYNYLAAVIPERYPIVKPVMMFFPSGDKELGLRQLKEAASTGKYSRYEARYILITFYYYFEKDMDSAEVFAKQLVESFPDNPVFERWRGRVAASKSESAIADSIFKNVLKKSEKNLEGYNTPRVRREANYYVGANLKKSGDNDGAFSYYKKCIEDSKKIDGDKESGFRINATLYSGTILETKGKYSEAKKYYNVVLDMREFKNSHTLAESYLARIDKLEKQGSK